MRTGRAEGWRQQRKSHPLRRAAQERGNDAGSEGPDKPGLGAPKSTSFRRLAPQSPASCSQFRPGRVLCVIATVCSHWRTKVESIHRSSIWLCLAVSSFFYSNAVILEQYLDFVSHGKCKVVCLSKSFLTDPVPMNLQFFG